jgi:Trk K+ transport system NAD-binding subunit
MMIAESLAPLHYPTSCAVIGARRLRRLTEMGGATGVIDMVIADDSSIARLSARSAIYPRGALITSIERGGNVIRPSGDTVFQTVDRLTVL